MKKVILIIIGIIIAVSTTVTAATIFNSQDIKYSSDKTNATNVKDSLDELYENLGKCPKGQECFELTGLASKVELGDYVNVIPRSTSYTISKDLTGYTSDQTINPSELNLWRVISKNEDGTIDVISEYVSNEEIYLYGKKGYLNFTGLMKMISEQFIDSAHIVEEAKFINGTKAYSICETLSREDCGGGMVNMELISLIGRTLGTTIGRKKSGEITEYWTQVRGLSSTLYYGHYIDRNGTLSQTSGAFLVISDSNTMNERGYKRGLRPILTIKASRNIKNGDGKSKETAYTLE